MLPVKGLCAVGSLSPVLVSRFGVDRSFVIIGTLQVFLTIQSITSLTVASFHRFLSIRRTFQQQAAANSKLVLGGMLIFQFGLPLLEAIPCAWITPRPPKITEFNQRMYPEITNRTLAYPCSFVSNDPEEAKRESLYSTPFALHIVFCTLIAVVLLVFSWRKVSQMRIERVISTKTKHLQRQLLIALTIQTFAPNFLYICMYGLSAASMEMENGVLSTMMSDLALSMASVHSMVNFCILLGTIPAYRKGIVDDFHFYCRRGKGRSNSRVIATTSFHPIFSRVASPRH
ncbi:hypothetical protein M3Y99_01218800 [Aphelenchoides fujianensis]|nr:hypothetical protein M3Y99_01218800 [Aphelenchoides fujianensis]